MSSIITHVILPGLGPVCPECFSRGSRHALTAQVCISAKANARFG